MERLISDEERIRRAEDVLERRRNTDLRISSESFGRESSNSRIRKILIQVLICLILYCAFYYIRNSKNEKFVFFTGNINNILEYDVDFKSIFEDVYSKFNEFNSTINANIEDAGNNEANQEGENNTQDDVNTDSTDEQSQENIDENMQNDNNSQGEIQTTDDALGIGGELDNENDKLSQSSDVQMNADAEYIAQKTNLINPLSSGVVTSNFGIRNSSSIVSGNHKGIDLGAQTGTIIVASSDGKVIEASSEGDFGIHLKIQNDDIVMIYAHCSELLVKEGDSILKGQQIAKVGATGKATGPHLHFEVRRENRAVNPELLLEF